MECKRCGARLQQGILICPECGARQRRHVSAVRCAHCGGRVPVEMTMCPHCGRDLRPSGLRWVLLFGALAVVVLLGNWGLRKLPFDRIIGQMADARSQIAGLIQFPDLGSENAATPEQVIAMATTLTPTTAPSARATTADGEVQTPAAVVATEIATELPLPAAVDPGSYAVQSGDTLASIGIKLGVSWQAIAEANGITENSILQIGQALVIPTPVPTPTVPATATVLPSATPAPSATSTANVVASATPLPTATVVAPTATRSAGESTTYKVRSGDSLITIGDAFGVSWESIAAANGLTASSTLSVGQELVIPGAGAPLPPTATPQPRPTATAVPPTPAPTPTPAPMLSAPVLQSPGSGASFTDSSALIELKWSPVDGMTAELQYQITVLWTEGGAEQQYQWLSAEPSTRLPQWLWSRADQPARSYRWYVTVVSASATGMPLSMPGETRSLQWQ